MGICPNVVLSKGFFSLLTKIPEDKQDFPVTGWCRMEEKHRFIPHSKFSAWNITAFCPCVCLALHKNFFQFIPKIEVVRLEPVNSDLNCDAGLQVQSLFGKELLSYGFKITSDLGVTYSTFTLKWFVHLSSHQRTMIIQSVLFWKYRLSLSV